MNNITSLVRWWIIFVLQLAGITLAGAFGFYDELWVGDQTKLSFVIIGIWFLTSASICWWHISDSGVHLMKIGWFLSELSLSLGLMGTVAGFLLMLGTAFGNIDVGNVNTLQEALSGMALGMSTALYTTLVGIVASQFIKMQLVNLEHKTDTDE